MVNRNESTFYESLESILDHVETVIIVDGSTKEEYERIKLFCESFPYPQILLHHIDPNYKEQIDLAFDLSFNTPDRWILRWDSDFTPKHNFKFLTELICALDDRDDYALIFGVEDPVTGELHFEDYLFTKNEGLYNIHIRRVVKDIIRRLKRKKQQRRVWVPYPRSYKILYFNQTFIYHHSSTKPDWKKIERKYQREWSLMSSKKRQGRTFEEYVREKEGIDVACTTLA